MHCLKRLLIIFSLGSLSNMEMTFNAAPSANAQPQPIDNDCTLHAVAYATGVEVADVSSITGAMGGPVHSAETVTTMLQTLGQRLESLPYRTFNSENTLINYLNNPFSNDDYIVGWQNNNGSVGHVINVEVRNRQITYIDCQSRTFNQVLPPHGPGFTYYSWRLLRNNRYTFTPFNQGAFTGESGGFLGRRDLNFDRNGFSSTCIGISILGVKRSDGIMLNLNAKCKDEQGRYKSTNTDLNHHIVNIDGRLAWRKHGKFVLSTKTCHLVVKENAILMCEARDRKGSYSEAAINLDAEIINRNGGLTVLDSF